MNFQLQLQPDAVPSKIPLTKKYIFMKKEATEKIYCLGKLILTTFVSLIFWNMWTISCWCSPKAPSHVSSWETD